MSCLSGLSAVCQARYVGLVQGTSKAQLAVEVLGVLCRQGQAFDRGTNTQAGPVLEEFTILTPDQGLACQRHRTAGPPALQAFQM